MTKHGDAMERPSAQLIKETANTHILIFERLTPCGRHMIWVGRPLFEAWVNDFCKHLAFPLPEVDLQQAPVALRIGITAIGSQAFATRERTGEDLVERLPRTKAGFDQRCLQRKAVLQRHIRLPVTHARRHIDRSMANQYYFHFILIVGSSRFTCPRQCPEALSQPHTVLPQAAAGSRHRQAGASAAHRAEGALRSGTPFANSLSWLLHTTKIANFR